MENADLWCDILHFLFTILLTFLLLFGHFLKEALGLDCLHIWKLILEKMNELLKLGRFFFFFFWL